MSVIDDLLEHNRAYVAGHGHRELPTSPALHLAVVTCMDSRLDLFGALGLDLGEVHLIRNAGGIATDDVVRSLLLSQRLLGTRSIMVIHHSRCGLETFDEEELQGELVTSIGARAPFRLGATATRTPTCAPRCRPCVGAPSSTRPRYADSSSTSTTEICERFYSTKGFLNPWETRR